MFRPPSQASPVSEPQAGDDCLNRRIQMADWDEPDPPIRPKDCGRNGTTPSVCYQQTLPRRIPARVISNQPVLTQIPDPSYSTQMLKFVLVGSRPVSIGAECPDLKVRLVATTSCRRMTASPRRRIPGGPGPMVDGEGLRSNRRYVSSQPGNPPPALIPNRPQTCCAFRPWCQSLRSPGGMGWKRNPIAAAPNVRLRRLQQRETTNQ